MLAKTVSDADSILALQALAWTLGEPARAERFLALTGFEPADLRTGAGDRAVLGATLGFLSAHEPDLVACADAIGTSPARLAAAGEALGR